jgi:hypothetical protein
MYHVILPEENFHTKQFVFFPANLDLSTQGILSKNWFI